ncbi:hypothetical protein CSA37_03870 [Candidatus Fermentibacteria bacterium]|nr:MAG: hypothetical protein CSA37_03870 [Candidatus Fermentibacteria bacterium]
MSRRHFSCGINMACFPVLAIDYSRFPYGNKNAFCKGIRNVSERHIPFQTSSDSLVSIVNAVRAAASGMGYF